LMTMLQKVLTF